MARVRYIHKYSIIILLTEPVGNSNLQYWGCFEKVSSSLHPLMNTAHSFLVPKLSFLLSMYSYFFLLLFRSVWILEIQPALAQLWQDQTWFLYQAELVAQELLLQMKGRVILLLVSDFFLLFSQITMLDGVKSNKDCVRLLDLAKKNKQFQIQSCWRKK